MPTFSCFALPALPLALGRAAVAAAALLAATAGAEPTAVTVRVISQDAKFVGDHTGGAEVILREAESGRELARGRTTGGTGDTARIMQATGRSPQRAGPEAAAFAASIDLTRPTLVELEVRGPLGRPASAVRITAQRWMMPGEPVTAGDGWVVELPGLAITPALTVAADGLRVTARVEPHCGCPIAPDSLWPAADYAVSASLWAGNRRLDQVPLAFTAAPGEFSGRLPAPSGGADELVVFARNRVTGATGLARLPLPR
ncbi:hypothetical protein [Novosphingobium sp.]|uniref:hypothetical protein n=1 Tax=Novosphingobium sp. TaxID=1874826 RepID=UPI002634C413|nr:hypothetical protein [Novosphingobium sp.]